MKSTLQKEKEEQNVFDQIVLGIAHELNNPNALLQTKNKKKKK